MDGKEVIEVCGRGDGTYGARLATPSQGEGHIYEVDSEPYIALDCLYRNLKAHNMSDNPEDYTVVMLPRGQHF